jgi:hypothetical protein
MPENVRTVVIESAKKHPESPILQSLAMLAADPTCEEQIIIRAYKAFVLARLRGPSSVFSDAS